MSYLHGLHPYGNGNKNVPLHRSKYPQVPLQSLASPWHSLGEILSAHGAPVAAQLAHAMQTEAAKPIVAFHTSEDPSRHLETYWAVVCRMHRSICEATRQSKLLIYYEKLKNVPTCVALQKALDLFH